MAIDIRVTDGISQGVEDKLNSIGNAARYANEQLKKLQTGINNTRADKIQSVVNNIGGATSGGAAARSAFSGTGASRASSDMRKYFESANVTAARELQRNRDAIAKVFNDDAKQRERINAKYVSDIEKASSKLSSKRNLINSINDNTGLANAKPTSAAELKRQQSMYDNLFYEPASVTAAKQLQQRRNEITKAFDDDAKQRSAMNEKYIAAIEKESAKLSSKMNIADAIKANTGTGIKEASITSRRQMQRMYDDLLGMSKTGSDALQRAQTASNAQRAPKNLASYINQTQIAPQPSASQRAQTQSSLDSVFTSFIPKTGTAASGTNALNSTLRNTQSAANAASTGVRGTASAMGDLEKSVSFLRSDGLRWAKVLWALSGATLTAGALVSMADAYSRVQNRLSVVTETQQQNNLLTQQVAQAAVNARQPLEETAKTYARIDLAMKNLGRSQTDSLQITQNVGKALKLGGASAGESASALLQLSQAFNKGKLDGDEFRSVMENSPILADKFAQKLGVTRGELLKLAPQGKITAKVMADAIIGATKDIDDAFGKLRPTIAESFTNMRTQATMFFGQLDKQMGITASMANLIGVFSNNLDKLAFVLAAATPLLLMFAGRLVLAGMAALGRYALSASASISAMQSPVTRVAVMLANLGRTGVAAMGSLISAASSATGRMYLLNNALFSSTGLMAALGTAAKRTGTMLLAAFSFGNILLVITTLIAAVIAFGDKWVVVAKDGITARDVLFAAWDEFKDFMVSAFNAAYDAVAAFFGNTVSDGMTTADKLSDAFTKTSLAIAVTIDAILTVFGNVVNAAKSLIYFFGDTIYNVVGLLVNGVTSLVNGAIDGLNMLGRGANKVLDWTGLSDELGHFGELGKAAGMEYKSQFVDSLNDFGMSHGAADSLMVAQARVMERAKKRAQDESTNASLRGTGKDLTAPPTTKPKKGETREEVLRREVAEETKAIAVAKRYGDERAVVSKIEEVDEKLRQKKFKTLMPQEEAMFRALVLQREEAQRVGKAQEALYEISGKRAEQDKRASTQAARNLFADGTISAGQMASAIENANRKYQQATDSLYEYRKALADTKEVSNTYGEDSVGKKAQQSARDNAINNNKALPDMTQVYNLAVEKYRLEQATAAYESVMNASVVAQQQNEYALLATTRAYSEGAISVDNYARQIATLKASQIDLSTNQLGIQDPFAPMRQGLYQLVGEMPSLGKAMADAVQSTLGNSMDNLSDGLSNLITNWDKMKEAATNALNRPATTLETIEYTLGNIIRNIGTDMVTAMIKMGAQMAVQWAMRQALSTAANATAVTEAAATGAAITAAMTPAAAVASVATAGAAPATGSASFATAMAAMLAAVPAFANGSDVINGAGNSRSDSIIARLSSGEMVMNANATKNNLSALRAMQSGATISGGGYQDNSVTITIVNSDGGSSTSTQGQDSAYSKELVSVVTTVVDKRLNQLSKQGQPLSR